MKRPGRWVPTFKEGEGKQSLLILFQRREGQDAESVGEEDTERKERGERNGNRCRCGKGAENTTHLKTAENLRASSPCLSWLLIAPSHSLTSR